MRKNWTLIAALALLAACGKEQPVSLPAAPAPIVTTIEAGFEEDTPGTRSRLSFTGASAKVLWTRGDSFKMLVYPPSTGKLTSRTFTTQDDGVTRASFSASGSALAGNYFVSAYPASVFGTTGGKNDDGSFSLIAPVPSRQPATPGGVAEGLNYAVAWSTSYAADLNFRNILSVIRFRMTGPLVPEVTSVIFDALMTVAGRATVYQQDGEPVIDFSKNWSANGYPRSSTITLDGPFAAGQDYCMAMVPARLPAGFNMYFCNAQGDTLYKHSSKPLTLGRGRIVDFGTIDIGDSWWSVKDETVEYMRQTKGSRKNVICVLADGYTEDQLDLFEVRAKSGIDYLFSTEPYKTYRDYFTVYLHRVPSEESGATVTDGNGNVITQRNTAFGSQWGEDSYGDMKADADKIQKYLKQNCPEIVSGELRYQDVPTLLLVNDLRYGGRCTTYSSGWGYCIVPFQRGGNLLTWNFPARQAVNPKDNSEGYRQTTDAEYDEMGRNVGDWRNTLAHEFGGHCYGRLGDEYWGSSYETGPATISSHTWTVPYSLNVAGRYENVPWKADLLDCLDEWTALSPDYGRIGIYHGAKNSLYYRWRPEPVSCMIDNRPYFNTWSRILIVRRIMTKTGETFDMADFKAKDVAVDPIRPAANASPAARRTAGRRVREAAEVLMLLPPVLVEDE